MILPKLKVFGESAVLLQWPQRIDPAINQEIYTLKAQLLNEKIEGIDFVLPAYNSITIGFDPFLLEFGFLKDTLVRLLHTQKKEGLEIQVRTLKIPVCYDPEFALDYKSLERALNLDWDKIIELHVSTSYRVYMLGFLPGFAYMGKLHKLLQCVRKGEPRKSVEPGSVGIAGLQTGIYPSKAPGGWQIIGRTPLDVLSPREEDPFLFHQGNQVEFYPIDVETYYKLKEKTEIDGQ